MCTLIALHRCVPGSPLVIAANRDEYLDRPAAPPSIWSRPGHAVAAPRDLRAGGTWLGVNAAGVFAGLTNRPLPQPDPTRRSRGHVVVEALDGGSAAAAARGLASLPAGAFNPFNLLVADRERAFAVVYDERPHLRELEPGIHVIGNADPNDRAVPKIARLLARAEGVARRAPVALLDELAELCREHAGEESARESACIHLGAYGTRSSSLLRLGDEAFDGAWQWADGPPCTTPYRDITGLLHVLASGSRQTTGEYEARALP